jgi:hypothetical protein
MKAIRVPADPKIPIHTIDVGQYGGDLTFEQLADAIGGQCEYVERFACPLTREYGLVGVTDEMGQYHDGAPNERARALYPVPGYTLKGDVLVMAEEFDPMEGRDFIDLPDERAAFLAVINLVAGAERTGPPSKQRLR